MRNLTISTLLLLAAATAVATAGVPRKPSATQFSSLWTHSPFTIKPPPEDRGPAASPLERDWSLGSIRPNGSGYSVTLINKKNRKERIRFVPGFSAGDFKLIEVRQNTQSSELSKVLIDKGGQRGWIGYDEKTIAVRASAKSKPSTKKPSTSSRSSRGSSRSGPPIPGRSTSSSSPRVRHVPRTK